jgi:protein TonB
VKRAGGRAPQLWIYGGSIAVHVALGAILVLLPTPERSRVVAIDFADVKKKPAPPKPPAAPVVQPRPSKARLASLPALAPAAPRAAAAPPSETSSRPSAAPAAGDGFADLGAIALKGDGKGSATIASAAATPAAPRATAHRVKQLVAVADGCGEPLVKPKVRTAGQITYTNEGQEAEIEGVVRIQVTVDETGKVIAATVLAGLGYGLDERAVAAARDSVFEPGTLCGQPVVATKVLAFTFELR